LGLATEHRILRLYNWADYIGETTLQDFEKKTGIRVIQDTMDSSEMAETKLSTGASGYDLVVLAGRMIPNLALAGALQPLERAKLQNWPNLDPSILAILDTVDRGNRFAVPYFWGTTGLTFDRKKVLERLPGANLASLEILLDPEKVSRLADCGINLLESPGDVIPMVLSYLDRDPNSEKADDLEAAAAALAKIRPFIRSIDSVGYLNALASGELCVSMSWAGEYVTASQRAREARQPLELVFDVPVSGAQIWLDTFVIPVDAPDPEAAYLFLDFMMEPRIIADATNHTRYANANRASAPFVDPAIRANPAIYPDEATRKRLWVVRPASPGSERLRLDIWNRIKAGG
jgi:putrescine transport system substrate-binding protein